MAYKKEYIIAMNTHKDQVVFGYNCNGETLYWDHYYKTWMYSKCSCVIDQKEIWDIIQRYSKLYPKATFNVYQLVQVRKLNTVEKS